MLRSSWPGENELKGILVDFIIYLSIYLFACLILFTLAILVLFIFCLFVLFVWFCVFGCFLFLFFVLVYV